jgi:hypothetical protein
VPLVFVVLIVSVLTSLVYASVCLFSAVTIRSKGAVETPGVGAYWYPSCNNSVSSLDWGVIGPGVQRNLTVYVRNEGNAPGILYLSAVDWDPPNASNYMTLSWDYSGNPLEPNETIRVTLTLTISQDIQDIVDFNFDTVIGIR